MSSAYQLKPWTVNVTPHPDIIAGNLDNATFAASLGSVIRKDPNCPKVYSDAREFFQATYLTKELKQLLQDVLKGLQGEPGDRVLQLRTPFGGGKTHALVSLYHITQNRQDLQGIPDLASLPNPGEVKVASFIGLDMDAATGTGELGIRNWELRIAPTSRILTPWGYLAWQIGGYDAYGLVETQDQQRIAPGNDILRQLFGDQPVLLLMDELLIYIENAMGITVGDSTFGRQILTFIQKLTEVVRELPKTVLVYSLQASVQEAIGNEGLLSVLDKLVSRIDAKKEPVSGDEVMKVLQRRLFTSIGDRDLIQEVARQQAELYRKFRETYSENPRENQEIQQQADLLADRIESSYPFHPDLLDLMYHRWGSLPSYQRTRGALQFLGRVVGALWQTQDNSALITPSSIPFSDSGVKQAFFSQVGERSAYDSVLSADIIGRKAKVKIVDNRIASDAPALAQLKVGTRLANAILMYSFGARGGEERGVMEQEIASATLTPGLDRTTITAALSDLKEQLLYLHYVGRRYRFETKPNLNKLISDEESKVNSDEVIETIRTDLEKAILTKQGGEVHRGKAIIWASDSSKISDNILQFQIVYLHPSWAEKSPEVIKIDALNWLEYRGHDKREYKNALAFVVPHPIQIDKARKAARISVAITSLVEQKKKYQFSPEDVEELTGKAKEANNELTAAIRRLYDEILLPLPCTDGTAPIRLEKIDLQSQLNTSQPLQERILDALKNHVFNQITVNKLVRLSGLENADTQYIKAKDLVSYFFKFPNYPKLLGVEPIKKAIFEAIASGKLGYVPNLTISPRGIPTVESAKLISFNSLIPQDELDLEGYLLSDNLTSLLQAQFKVKEDQETVSYSQVKVPEETIAAILQEEPNKTLTEKTTTSSISRSILVDIKEKRKPAKQYSLEAITNKAQIFQLFELLQTLSDKADSMTVHIKVKANTNTEFDLNWLRNAIEEPLDEQDIEASTKVE